MHAQWIEMLFQCPVNILKYTVSVESDVEIMLGFRWYLSIEFIQFELQKCYFFSNNIISINLRINIKLKSIFFTAIFLFNNIFITIKQTRYNPNTPHFPKKKGIRHSSPLSRFLVTRFAAWRAREKQNSFASLLRYS